VKNKIPHIVLLKIEKRLEQSK